MIKNDKSNPASSDTDQHLASDTPNTLDYERMAQAAIGIAGGLSRLAKISK